MDNVFSESKIRSNFGFSDIALDRATALSVTREAGNGVSRHSTVLISGEHGARKEALYEAVMTLSRSIAGRTDLRSLVSGVADSLRGIIAFDHLALILHE